MLVVGALAAAMRRHCTGEGDVALSWALAYAEYASLAQAGVFPVLVLPANVVGMAAALRRMRAPSTPEQQRAMWVQAFLAFWGTPPVVAGPGVVQPTGAGVLSALLVPVFVLNVSVDTFFARLAAQLHTATTTNTVTLPGPVVVSLT